jgi:hypothetical protein
VALLTGCGQGNSANNIANTPIDSTLANTPPSSEASVTPTVDTPQHSQISSPPSQPVTADSVATPAASSTGEVCRLRIVNTFNDSDKAFACSISLNEADRILSLTPIEHPEQLVKIIYQGNNTYTVQFYNNGEMEAEKTVYRKSELETAENNFVYTSRTGEITLTISNN